MDEERVDFQVPTRFVGLLLGRAGSKVLSLQERFNCKIELTTKDAKERGDAFATFMVAGRPSDCATVKELMLEDVARADSQPPIGHNNGNEHAPPPAARREYDVKTWNSLFPDSCVDVPTDVLNPEHFPAFRNRAVGHQARNVMAVVEELGGTRRVGIRLRGIGSGFREGVERCELNQPMHFHVSAAPELLDKAVAKVKELIQNAKAEMADDRPGSYPPPAGMHDRPREWDRERGRPGDWDGGGAGGGRQLDRDGGNGKGRGDYDGMYAPRPFDRPNSRDRERGRDGGGHDYPPPYLRDSSRDRDFAPPKGEYLPPPPSQSRSDRPSLYGPPPDDCQPEARGKPFYRPPFPDSCDLVYLDGIHDRHFAEVRGRVIGEKGANILRIIEELGGRTKGRVRSRGRGSGFLEGPEEREIDKPFHFHVSAAPEVLPAMLDKLRALIKNTIMSLKLDEGEEPRGGEREREREWERERDRERERERERERDRVAPRGDRGYEYPDPRDAGRGGGRGDWEVSAPPLPRYDYPDPRDNRPQSRESFDRPMERGRPDERVADWGDGNKARGRYLDHNAPSQPSRSLGVPQSMPLKPRLPFRIERLGGSYVSISINATGTDPRASLLTISFDKLETEYSCSIKKMSPVEMRACGWHEDGAALQITGRADDCDACQMRVEFEATNIVAASNSLSSFDGGYDRGRERGAERGAERGFERDANRGFAAEAGKRKAESVDDPPRVASLGAGADPPPDPRRRRVMEHDHSREAGYQDSQLRPPLHDHTYHHQPRHSSPLLATPAAVDDWDAYPNGNSEGPGERDGGH